MTRMITSAQAATILGIKPSRVRQLCIARRIPGARKIGRQWYIPVNWNSEPVAERNGVLEFRLITVLPPKSGRGSRKYSAAMRRIHDEPVAQEVSSTTSERQHEGSSEGDD